eukprot:gb/GFBE01013811.1/.p1 GENE.gb/GFBE01013811.1/~~gb/GFBE01013811.1/.p1  ORF type:complete len:365 (+),score=58.04 gb/GFBE01013811.1/:1-1095(+)
MARGSDLNRRDAQDVAHRPEYAREFAQEYAQLQLAAGGNELGSPLVLIDLGRIRASLQDWFERSPSLRPVYAVGCQCDLGVLKLMTEAGCGFACVTPSEVDHVLSIGASPQDVHYRAPLKVKTHLCEMRKKGVQLLSFDSASDLRKIAVAHRGAELLLQVNLGRQMDGAEPADWGTLLQLASQLSLRVTGVAFGECADNAQALIAAQGIFALATELGHHMTAVHLFNQGMDVGLLQEHIFRCFPHEDFADLRVMVELGQHFMSRASSLLAKGMLREYGASGEPYIRSIGNFDVCGLHGYLGDKEPQNLAVRREGSENTFVEEHNKWLLFEGGGIRATCCGHRPVVKVLCYACEGYGGCVSFEKA